MKAARLALDLMAQYFVKSPKYFRGCLHKNESDFALKVVRPLLVEIQRARDLRDSTGYLYATKKAAMLYDDIRKKNECTTLSLDS